MKAHLSQAFSEEEGPLAIEGKTVYIEGSKEKLKQLASFLNQVSDYLDDHDLCHMHFRDYEPNWNKEEYIDVAIELKKST